MEYRKTDTMIQDNINFYTTVTHILITPMISQKSSLNHVFLWRLQCYGYVALAKSFFHSVIKTQQKKTNKRVIKPKKRLAW